MRLERGLRKRTCHKYKTSIPKGEKHMAVYSASRFGWWNERSNVCFICLEVGLRKIKKSIKGGIINRRNNQLAQLVLEEL